MGRQSTFTQEVADAICARLSTGEPLAKICRDDDMPHDNTVRDWQKASPDFAIAIARAREDGFDALAAECLDIANTPMQGTEITEKSNGDIEVKTGDMLGHRKLQIDTRLKLLAKWDPKRYGDKMTTELTGANGGPVEITRIERVIVDPK